MGPKTKKQSTALLKLNHVAYYKVTVIPHRSFSTVRGVISEDDFRGDSENHILEGFRQRDVVTISRILLCREGKEMGTKHVIFTFDSTTQPEFVKAWNLNFKVRPHVPNSRWCFRCQTFDHMRNVWWGCCPPTGTCYISHSTPLTVEGHMLLILEAAQTGNAPNKL